MTKSAKDRNGGLPKKKTRGKKQEAKSLDGEMELHDSIKKKRRGMRLRMGGRWRGGGTLLLCSHSFCGCCLSLAVDNDEANAGGMIGSQAQSEHFADEVANGVQRNLRENSEFSPEILDFSSLILFTGELLVTEFFP